MKILDKIFYQRLESIRHALNCYILEKKEDNSVILAPQIINPIVYDKCVGRMVEKFFDAMPLEESNEDDYEFTNEEYYDDEDDSDEELQIPSASRRPMCSVARPSSSDRPVEIAIPDFLRKNKLDDVLETKAETFSNMLLRLIDEKGLKDSEVYKKQTLTADFFQRSVEIKIIFQVRRLQFHFVWRYS